jgi:hypothetical protein
MNHTVITRPCCQREWWCSSTSWPASASTRVAFWGSDRTSEIGYCTITAGLPRESHHCWGSKVSRLLVEVVHRSKNFARGSSILRSSDVEREVCEPIPGILTGTVRQPKIIPRQPVSLRGCCLAVFGVRLENPISARTTPRPSEKMRRNKHINELLPVAGPSWLALSGAENCMARPAPQ